MPKANTEGAPKGSEHDAKPRPASKGSSRLVKLTSVYEAPPRCTSQHLKKDVKDNNLPGNSYKQKQQKVDMETTSVYSTRSHDSTAKTDIAELMHPKKHGKRSARPRGKNSTPWGPLEGLLNSEREPSEYGNDKNVGSKKMKSNQGGNPPCRASKRVHKLKENSSEGSKAELLAIKTDIAERIDTIKRGKRSVRPRGNIPASWVPMDGLQNFEKELSKHGNDQKVGSKKMKSTHGATTLCNAYIIEQTDVMMVDTLGEVEESIGAEANKRTGVPMTDTLDEAEDGNGSDANATEQIGVTIPNTSFEFKDSNHADANAVEQMEVWMVDTTAEVKLSNGENEKNVVQAGVPTTDTLADPKESNGSIANPLEQSALQMNDVADAQQGKANNAEFVREISSGLDLEVVDENFDLSSAESALASLYGESERDLCIEFAVKLLMEEMPLPKEATQVEEFFRQKMNGEKSAKP